MAGLVPATHDFLPAAATLINPFNPNASATQTRVP
jgi:hypothetical protein